MIDEIKVDLECPVSVGNGARRKAPGRNVQSHVPGMVDPRTLHQANLANDLRPHVQSRAGIAPGFERQAGPSFGIRYGGWHERTLLPRRVMRTLTTQDILSISHLC